MRYAWKYIILGLRKRQNLTQEKLAKRLGVTFQAISVWERGKGTPRSQTQRKIITIIKKSKMYLKTLSSVGKKSQKPYTRVPHKIKLQIAKEYSDGSSMEEIIKKFKVGTYTVIRALKEEGVKSRSRSEGLRLVLASKRKTFPPTYPASAYVKNIKNRLTRQHALKLLAVMLLTDGCLTRSYNYSLNFTSKDIEMHKIFSDLIFFLTKNSISTFYHQKLVSTFNNQEANKLADRLLSLSPTYKKSPKDVSKESYLKGPQPTLGFLLTSSTWVKREALKIAMSAEGSIMTSRSKKIFAPKLQFACSHPTLIYQWAEIINSLGIENHIIYDNKSWSGYKAIVTGKHDSILRFSKIGFIDGSKVQNSSSVHYPCCEKNAVLQGVIDFIQNIIVGGISYTKWSDRKFWTTLNSFVKKHQNTKPSK